MVWLPERIAQYLWRNPGELTDLPLFGVLQRIGVLERDEASDLMAERARDRNRVFATAICDGCADTAIETLRDTAFIIIGCGGLGSSTAIMLASLAAKNFVLVDGDAIEESNLNRLLWADRSQVGESKAHALAAHLEWRFQARAVAHHVFLQPDDLHAIAAQYARAFVILAVDDNVVARSAIRSLHESGTQPYVHIGYVGSLCSVGPLVTRREDPCPFCGAQTLEFVDSTRFVAPSAAPNNSLIAGILTAQLLRWAGKLTSVIHARRWVLDLVDGSVNVQMIRKDLRCTACSSVALTAQPYSRARL